MENQNPIKTLKVAITGPSGSGKSTLIRALCNDDNLNKFLYFSISHTTRPRRFNEVEGKDYYFVSKEYFENMIDQDMFIEYETYNGNFYGTSNVQYQSISNFKDFSEKEIKDRNRKIIVFDIERKGVANLKRKESSLISIFIYTTKETIKNRLLGRIKTKRLNIDQVVEIDKRLDQFDLDMSMFEQNIYDYAIENEDLDKAIFQLKEIIKKLL